MSVFDDFMIGEATKKTQEISDLLTQRNALRTALVNLLRLAKECIADPDDRSEIQQADAALDAALKL